MGDEIVNLSQECIIYKMRVYFYISIWDNYTIPYKYLILDGIWPRIANNYDFLATWVPDYRLLAYFVEDKRNEVGFAWVATDICD